MCTDVYCIMSRSQWIHYCMKMYGIHNLYISGRHRAVLTYVCFHVNIMLLDTTTILCQRARTVPLVCHTVVQEMRKDWKIVNG